MADFYYTDLRVEVILPAKWFHQRHSNALLFTIYFLYAVVTHKIVIFLTFAWERKGVLCKLFPNVFASNDFSQSNCFEKITSSRWCFFNCNSWQNSFLRLSFKKITPETRGFSSSSRPLTSVVFYDFYVT